MRHLARLLLSTAISTMSFTTISAVELPAPVTAAIAVPAAAGFPGFVKRAQAGERLKVVFFGASLTWGANASDQEVTSYRAVIRDRLDEQYPLAHFSCYDAAIGGTGSQLGAFRVERDVLAHKPDLVFVDFTANDNIYDADPESLSSYESILRRLAQAGIPVVQVAFPFRWDIERAKLPTMKRLAAHRALAEAYGNGWGDAVTSIVDRTASGELKMTDIWVTDGVHPYDIGYRAFADAAWAGYLGAVERKLAPVVPAEQLNPTTYATLNRVRLAKLGTQPAGWRTGITYRTGLNHDWLMSRWIDDLAIASNREIGADGKPTAKPQEVAPLRFTVDAATVMIFGEASATSCTFRVRIDGTVVTGSKAQVKDTDLFDANRWKNGNGHLVFELARKLDTAKPHLVEIEPVFTEGQAQELRIESICVAGGKATVERAP